MARAFVSVGANLDPERNVLAALRLLKRQARITAVSTLYRSRALGRPGDPDFVNGAVEVHTHLSPRELKLEVLRAVEAALGRERTEDRDAPRPIDLDLVLYGDVHSSEPDLALPDPDIGRRAFLARPLAELAPSLVPPGAEETLAEMAARLSEEEMAPLTEYTERVRDLLTNEP